MSVDELLRQACIYAEQDREAYLAAFENCESDPQYEAIRKETQLFLNELRKYRRKRWGKSGSDILDEVLKKCR